MKINTDYVPIKVPRRYITTIVIEEEAEYNAMCNILLSYKGKGYNDSMAKYILARLNEQVASYRCPCCGK